jgi:hypothetical protein
MIIRRLTALAVVLLMGGVGAAAAQSLADVAAKEDARRKQQTKKASKVYTNKDVKGADRSQTPAPGTAAPASAAAPGAPAAGAGEEGASQDASTEEGAKAEGTAEKPPTDEEVRDSDEKRWRARITEAREALARSEIFAQALQSQINALQADFVARDDPAQRAVIETQRKKSLAQLDRVKAEMITQKKAIADIEEEARRAGVPPGWLR